MNREQTAALIVAAGNTPGSAAFEPLEKIGILSAAQRLIVVFKQAGVQRITIIAGDDMEKLEKHVARMGVVCLREQKENAQMLDCVKTGLAYLENKCDRVLVTPVDVPLFSSGTVEALMAQHEPLTVPVFEGRPGHPLLLSAALFPAVLGYDGEGGLSGAVRAAGISRAGVEVQDKGVLLNVKDTKEFGSLVESHSLRKLRPEAKIRLAREEACYGPGMHQLLMLVDEEKSVQLACRQMGMSYSKGWKMIANTEQQLGYQVVERRQGGKDGGSSSITPKGRALMEKYAAFEAECAEKIGRVFEKYFGGDV